MLNLLQNRHGMNIVGQGGKIILFTLPSLTAAILIHAFFPRFAAMPGALGFLRPAGYVLLALGLALWGTAMVQLLTGFPKGRLVTNGAYGVVRNPIYSSAAFFILPGVALLAAAWVYLAVSIFLFVGVNIFIRTEERQLAEAFGEAYEAYRARVDRMVPFLWS